MSDTQTCDQISATWRREVSDRIIAACQEGTHVHLNYCFMDTVFGFSRQQYSDEEGRKEIENTYDIGRTAGIISTHYRYLCIECGETVIGYDYPYVEAEKEGYQCSACLVRTEAEDVLPNVSVRVHPDFNQAIRGEFFAPAAHMPRLWREFQEKVRTCDSPTSQEMRTLRSAFFVVVDEVAKLEEIE